VSYKLSLDALSVDSFEAGAYTAAADTHFRDCTSFPVCPRTDTTDAAAQDQEANRLPGDSMDTYAPGCTALPELCPTG
jgi:hypothetical protein